jgi:UDPglucose 6-dehydrogenase
MQEMMKNNIGIIGLWHLGCVLCAVWSKLGNYLIGFDYDIARVEKLKKGTMPIFEPNLSETIQESINNRLITFSNDISSLSTCDYIFLAYDTPVLDNDLSDATILEKVVCDIRNVMKNEAILIISSQSPVGFCDYLRLKLKEKNQSLELAYSPENLRLGDAIHCYLNPGRIILGTADSTTETRCKDLFSPLQADILTMGLKSAEMVKHGINSFLAMSIVFANHLAEICEYTGARIDDVTLGMKSDPRIGERAYLSPGIGFSGGTLGRDLKVLEQKNQEANGNAKIFGIIHDLNNERKYSILTTIEKILTAIKGDSIGILGATYKPGTSTLRRSLPLEIINLFTAKGFKVKVYDPKANYDELSFKPEFLIASSIEGVSNSVDILVLLTEWEEFKIYDWENIPRKMRNPFFFDTKNFLDEKKMTTIGFKYCSIGR